MGDTIIRCSEHLQNFTLMDNTCLKTPTLSMQAMGLFAYLMTLPNDWVIYKSELVNHFSNGRDAVYKAFNELIDNGFITFKEVKNEKNQFQSYEYYIHEQPVSEKKRSIRKTKNKDNEEAVNGKPETEKPVTGIPYTGNPSLLSTNKQRTDVLSTNKASTPEKKKEKKTKKTDIDKYNSYLESITNKQRSDSLELVETMKLALKALDPKFNRKTEQFLEWQFLFANFLIESGRTVDEVKNTINYALGDKFWVKRVFGPANLIKSYSTIYQQSVADKVSNNTPGNSKYRQVYTDEEYRQMSDDLDSVSF